MKKHLAIMSQSTIDAILSGKKTIETRFSKHNIPPFGQVNKGDLVFMKPPGKDIVGQFRVKKILSIEGMEQSDVQKIFKDFGRQIRNGNKIEDDKYVADKIDARFGTLIFVGESERLITAPIRIKKSDQRGWMVLE
jgi:hypothetical protein